MPGWAFHADTKSLWLISGGAVVLHSQEEVFLVEKLQIFQELRSVGMRSSTKARAGSVGMRSSTKDVIRQFLHLNYFNHKNLGFP